MTPITLTLTLLAVGLSVSAVEQYAWIGEFRSRGYFDWQILRTSSTLWRRFPFRLAEPLIASHVGVRVMLLSQLGLAAVLVMPLPLRALGVVVCALGVLNCVMAIRCPIGHDGAHQMATILCFAIGPMLLAANATFRLICAWFVVSELILAYFIAGLAKLHGAGWRSGRSLGDILQTVTYGHSRLSHLLRNSPRLSCLLSWAVIAFEVCSPLMLLLPRPYVAVMIAMGVVFHAAIAVVMGLTTFFWIFVAAYPILWLVVSPTQWNSVV